MSMNRVKRYLAIRLLKYVPTDRLKDEAHRREFNDYYKDICKRMFELYGEHEN